MVKPSGPRWTSMNFISYIQSDRVSIYLRLYLRFPSARSSPASASRRLRISATATPSSSFLADQTTSHRREHPILAVWVLPRTDDGQGDYQPFRVAAGERGEQHVPAAPTVVERVVIEK
ncbi:DUF6924 domain-containing protein [Nocardia arthritidis]|uniref:DUF6924 domain-containing protein n=1 Tax=Nocardia arthritidis TaxID=228602 RepID=UPI003D1615DD